MADMKDLRRQAAHRKRRIIINNDGNDGIGLPSPVTPAQFLAQRTTALAGSHVDSIFYCTGVVNQYTHRSSIAEQRGDHDRWAFARDLIEQGTDALEVMVEFGHAHHMEVFWSMRMNDTHDYARDINFTKWKEEHPEYLMGQRGDTIPWREENDWPSRWSALDYGHPAVRDRIFDLLREVCEHYDIDGLELDLFRHPLYFKPQYVGEPVTQEQCDAMTGLLRRVRNMADEIGTRRGRPILIAARIPDSLGYCKEIGLDVSRWLEEELVDLLIGTCYFQLEPWENFVALGRRHNVPVYACLSGSRFVDPNNGRIKLPLEHWYGDARAAWEAGVDGIYLFNVFDPHDARFRELGDPKLLQQMNVPYKFVSGSTWRPDYWLKNGSRWCRAPQL